MPPSGIHEAELIILLLLSFVIIFAGVARWLDAPYPVVLVIAGLGLSFLPGIPRISLDPEVIFLVVLPPLLYSSARITSWRDFSNGFVSIAMLAVGLVGFTVIAVAAVGPWLLPGLDWRVGLVLGSVVATTDAIAATSMAKRIGLPKSIVDLLEGESLINDATGLLALEFATAIVVNGQHPTAVTGTFRLLYLSGAAIASGLAVARVVEWLGRRIDDGPIEVAVDLLAPYAAYFAAEAIHASGVLAVVSAGLYLGHRSSLLLSPGVRIRMRAVWDSLAFILNGFVFVLIGLQLPSVLEGVSELSNQNVILYSALFSVCLIIIRLIWTYPGAYLAHVIRTRLMKRNEERLNARQTFVVGWIGMRGVIALAAAMSLPAMTADGRAFPHRDLIVFLTFSVILTTLVIQGLTLTPLVRVLRLTDIEGQKRDKQDGRRLVLEAALAHVRELQQANPWSSEEIYDDLARHYEHRIAGFGAPWYQDGESAPGSHNRYLEISRLLLQEERKSALRLRDEGRLSDELLREIEHELDLSETRLTAMSDRTTAA